MAQRSALGPDLVIAGAARCGTSTLAAHLSRHPNIDMGMVKEPNYFSRHFDLGEEWYDGLFAKRDDGILRLDGSTSYTYPQFPDALGRLATAAPDTFVVYSVRDPLERAISHFLFLRHYFHKETANDFGEAMRNGSYYTDVSDYARWLPQLRALFPDRLLVVPFDAVTQSRDEVLAVIYEGIGIPLQAVEEAEVEAHRNNTVEFRSQGVRRAVGLLRRNRTYLRVRSAVGPHRVRKIRSLLTRDTVLPTAAEALASCDEQQLAELDAFRTRARLAVREHLLDQDTQRHLSWAEHWTTAPDLIKGPSSPDRADT